MVKFPSGKNGPIYTVDLYWSELLKSADLVPVMFSYQCQHVLSVTAMVPMVMR